MALRVAGCRIQVDFFHLKQSMIQVQIALSTHICLFASVVLHDYIELLHKILLHKIKV